MSDIPGLVAHEVTGGEKTPHHWVGPLYELRCDTCGRRWPCTYLPWVRTPGVDPTLVTSSCNACREGTVVWADKEWEE